MQTACATVIGGEGPPLLLIHGWPQTWYQWPLIMPTLARDFTVVAVDQRGIGLSDKPQTGYDVGTQANDMVALMEALGYRRFAVIGFDVGMPIGHALAADHPQRIERLIVGEAIITGLTASPPFSPGPLNKRTWHIAFNRLGPDVNEALVRGREHIYFGSEFAVSAGTSLPDDVVRYYVERLASSPDALRGSFGSYRAIDENYAQNQVRKTMRLTPPVLAIGGGKSPTAVVAGHGVLEPDSSPRHIHETRRSFKTLSHTEQPPRRPRKCTKRCSRSIRTASIQGRSGQRRKAADKTCRSTNANDGSY
jgi:pimeloyl-ACP methyl ester carboxylesterase